MGIINRGSERIITTIAILFAATLLTACGSLTPEQRAAAKERRMQNYAQWTVREYLGTVMLSSRTLVPLGKDEHTHSVLGYFWWGGVPDEFIPHNVDSHDNEFCEAKNATLEYRGSVRMPGLGQNSIQEMTDLRNMPERIGGARSIRDSVAQQSELQGPLAKYSNAVSQAIRQKYFGKFECVDQSKKLLFSVLFAPTTIRPGDYDSGMKTSLGASIYWSRTYQFP